MAKRKSLLEFPCEFPIKIFAAADCDLLAPARAIVEKYTGALNDDRISTRPSTGNRYVAITFNITASSQEQLDNIYRELTARDDVVMAL